MRFDYLNVQQHNGVARITVSRPDKLNALNAATITELDEAIAALLVRQEIGALIITGSGEKAFIAGADIAELRALSVPDAERFAARGQALMRRIETASIPVIAAINGFALGGGLELALACHIRYASDNARLGLPEIKLGLIPGFGGTQRLPRAVGRARAIEMMLSGEPVDARTAQLDGLVQTVVAQNELLTTATALAERLANQAPVARARILASVDAGLDLPLERAMELERSNFTICCATEDMKEGTSAFLERRAPSFKGR